MRNRMREAIFAMTAFAGLWSAGVAQATDLPTKAPLYKAPIAAPFTWTGIYVGVHVGYGWGNKDFSLPDIEGQEFCQYHSGHKKKCFDFTELNGFGHDLSGFLGGVQAGFNIQSGAWVFGLEGQFSWTDMDQESNVHLGEYRRKKCCWYWSEKSIDLLAKTEVNWVATVAARVGYAWDRFLIYAKGGVAFADQDYDWLITKGDYDFATAKFGETRTGYMVGAGVEWALWQNISAKIEYNFMDFGSRTLNAVADVKGYPKDFKVDIDEQMHVVKFGINYRFVPGAVIAKY